MKNFRTYNLAIEFYHQAKSAKMNGALKSQYERALLSIPLNLSEGSAKPTAKDRRKFYYIALGSFREVQTLLQIQNNTDLLVCAYRLGAHLYLLCKNT